MLVLIVLVVVAAGVYGFLQFRTDALTEMVAHGLSRQRPVHHRPRRTRSITWSCCCTSPHTKRGGLFFIPANLGLQIAELGRFDRISVLYAAGNLDAAAQEDGAARQGADPVPCRAARTTTIANIVDLLGGIETCSSPTPSTASRGATATLLPSGSVTLDGDKALQYLELRGPDRGGNGEGRAPAEVPAVASQNGSASRRPRISSATPRRTPCSRAILQTNISSRGVDSLVRELGRLDPDHLVFQRVMGSLRQVEGVNGEVLLPHYEGALIRETVSQMSQAIRNQSEASDRVGHGPHRDPQRDRPGRSRAPHQGALRELRFRGRLVRQRRQRQVREHRRARPPRQPRCGEARGRDHPLRADARPAERLQRRGRDRDPGKGFRWTIRQTVAAPRPSTAATVLEEHRPRTRWSSTWAGSAAGPITS